jgi:hypothetical protein
MKQLIWIFSHGQPLDTRHIPGRRPPYRFQHWTRTRRPLYLSKRTTPLPFASLTILEQSHTGCRVAESGHVKRCQSTLEVTDQARKRRERERSHRICEGGVSPGLQKYRDDVRAASLADDHERSQAHLK